MRLGKMDDLRLLLLAMTVVSRVEGFTSKFLDAILPKSVRRLFELSFIPHIEADLATLHLLWHHCGHLSD